MIHTGHGEPLSEVRVIDCTQAIFGAGATLLLADMGADVIKVEPVWGDFMRPSRWEHDGDSGPWLAMNRNKRSVALDLRAPRCKEFFTSLVAGADVLVHNFRIGRMEALGFGFEQVRHINPRIIYAHLSAYGDRGPMRTWAGGDLWAQALGGAESVQGTPGSEPCLINVPLADQGGAAIGALAIMAALMARQNNQSAQRVSTSLIDAVLNMQSGQAADYLIDGRKIGKGGRGWRGMFPFGAYRASDGDVIIIHGADDAEWAQLCALLGIADVLDNPNYQTPQMRMEKRTELYALLDAAFSLRTRAEWQETFHANGLRCDPCLDYEETFEHPQVIANNHLLDVEHPERGTLKMISRPFELNGNRGTVRFAPPLLGQHTRELLVELGVAEAEIDGLTESGVIFCAEPH